MKTSINPHRRKFLRRTAAMATGVALAGPLQQLYASQLHQSTRRNDFRPYGDLHPTKDHTTGLEIIKLPQGFSYQSFGWTGDLMDDGTYTPDRHDGMAIMRVSGRRRRHSKKSFVLMRNHERTIEGPDSLLPTVGNGTAPLYDDFELPGVISGISGGTTAVVFKNNRFVESRATLGGTMTNCAGGPTPWGSWLSCEESLVMASLIGAKDHGYVFEVPAPELGQASTMPIVDMGLMKHEAVAVDPRTGCVYLTEDNGPNSGFYRFKPHDCSRRVGALESGGQLEMLRVVGVDNADLANVQQGDKFRVDWAPISDPNAGPEFLESPGEGLPDIEGGGKSGPYLQGEALGGANFNRGEGCWYHKGVIYFTDTSAGPAGKGVVWAYKPQRYHRGNRSILKAIFVSPNEDTADNPDNITVSPRGGILVCEDGGGKTGENGREFGTRLIAIDQAGQSTFFAENNFILDTAIADKPLITTNDYRSSEFAGACFDPTGKYLFVNIQTPGITLAITGPWRKGIL